MHANFDEMRSKNKLLASMPGLIVQHKTNKAGESVAYYSMDVNGKRVSLGRLSLDDVQQVYHAYKAQQKPKPPKWVKDTVNQGLDRFLAEYPKFQTDAADLKGIWSNRVSHDHKNRIKKYRNDFGDKRISELTQEEISNYIHKGFLGDGRTQNHELLKHVFRFWVSVGLATANLAANTMPPLKQKRKRERLTIEQYNAIHAIAPAWLQNAMDLALLTLQDRQELVRMQYSDIKDGALYVVRNKVVTRTDNAYIRIAIGPELDKVIKRCRAQPWVTKYLVSWRPGKPTTGDYLSRHFAQYRDKTGLFDGWEDGRKPPFKELRSTGANRYYELGYSKAAVKELLGHTTDKMTQHYINGHNIEWNEAKAR